MADQPAPRRATKQQLVAMVEKLTQEKLSKILALDQRRVRVTMVGATADGKGMIVEVR